MPKTYTLRNVPDQVADGLRERAERNGRSIQAELLHIVETAVIDKASLLDRIAEFRGSLKSPMKLNDIDTAISEGRP